MELFAALDRTIVSTALLTILRELGGVTQLSWVVTDLFDRQHDRRPLYGKFGGIHGRKIVLQVAIVMGSALCGLAETMMQTHVCLLRRQLMSPPGKDHIYLCCGEAVLRRDGSLALKSDVISAFECPTKIANDNYVTLPQSIIVLQLSEDERENSVVDQILSMDACKSLGEHKSQSQIARRHGGMLTRRPLTVVATGYHGVSGSAAHRASTGKIGRIDARERKVVNLLNVRAIRQHLCTCRGMISSVDTSSPILSKIGSSKLSGKGSNSGNDRMFEPFTSLADRASSGGGGCWSKAALTMAFSGYLSRG